MILQYIVSFDIIYNLNKIKKCKSLCWKLFLLMHTPCMKSGFLVAVLIWECLAEICLMAHFQHDWQLTICAQDKAIKDSF